MNANADNAIDDAVAALAAGKMIVVVDDPERENEGDLLVAANAITQEQMAFMVKHTTGIICVPMSEERAERLHLPTMVANNEDPHGTAFTVTVDHIGSGTGVSAASRTSTVRALADDDTPPTALRRPGHVFPLRAQPGGVLVRPGHTEAAVELTRLAGRGDVAVIGEIVDLDGSMRTGDSLREFARRHDLPVLTIAELIRHRRASSRTLQRVAEAELPTRHGLFRAIAYRNPVDGVEHLALTVGDIQRAGGSSAGALVRVHSECLTGDVLGSLRCDCGGQLDQALRAIAAEGCGAVVYLRGHEGRGIGLGHKIRAYSLQDQGLDTVEANLAQGLPVDSRTYDVGAQILRDLGLVRLRLITNNPSKYNGLETFGLSVVSRVAMPVLVTSENVRYLQTKVERMGHLLPANWGVQGA